MTIFSQELIVFIMKRAPIISWPYKDAPNMYFGSPYMNGKLFQKSNTITTHKKRLVFLQINVL